MKSPSDRAVPADRWEFYKNRPEQWQWRKFRENKVVAVSRDAFPTRQACVRDARARGYTGT